jgi:DNA repair protein RadC
MSESSNNLTFVREITVNYKGPRRKISESIKEANYAAKIIRSLLRDNSREHFIGLYLNGAHEVIAYSVLGTGLANSCPVHPREVFQPAILSGAVAVLVAHNHPSGECTPSCADRTVTKSLKEAGDIIGIKLLDHIIVTDSNHYSILTEEGFM